MDGSVVVIDLLKRCKRMTEWCMSGEERQVKKLVGLTVRRRSSVEVAVRSENGSEE